jgi:hypothetical protein
VKTQLQQQCDTLRIINITASLKSSFKQWSEVWSSLKTVPTKHFKIAATSGKSLGPKGLLSLWSQVQALWLLIWWPLEAYMVVNFRVRGISRGARKLTRTPTLNYIYIYIYIYIYCIKRVFKKYFILKYIKIIFIYILKIIFNIIHQNYLKI